MKQSILLFFLLVILVFSFALLLCLSFSAKVDGTAVVTAVQDGDTFSADPVGRIRLADADAPE